MSHETRSRPGNGRMPKLRIAIAVAVVAGVVLGVGGTARAAASDRRVSADRWVRGICSAWVDYLDRVEAASVMVPDDVDTETVATTSAEPDRRAAVRLQQRVVDASTAVSAAVGVGIPDVADGRSVRNDYRATVEDYRQSDLDLLHAIERAPTSSGPAFEDALERALERSWEQWEIIGHNPIDEVRDVPALASAVDGEGSCGDVDAWFDLGYASDVTIGDCVDIDERTIVPCDEPHDGELYLQLDHPAERGVPYPGTRAIEAFGDEQCTVAFAGYVGRDYASSEYDFVYRYPDQPGWDANDREILCFVVNPDESPLTGTVKGSGS